MPAAAVDAAGSGDDDDDDGWSQMMSRTLQTAVDSQRVVSPATRLTDARLLRLSATCTPLIHSQTHAQPQPHSQRVVVRHSLSDTAAPAAAQMLPPLPRTPSSYRTSFSRLQPVDIPDVDNGRHSNAAISPRDTGSDTRKRFHLFSSHVN